MKLIIKGSFPGLNEYIDANRRNKYAAAAMKKQVEHVVMLTAKSQLRGARFTGPVVMRYLWVEKNRRRDKDNVSSFGQKCIQDALVAANILHGDGWAGIDRFTDDFAVDAKNPRIEILIEEAALCE